MACVCFIAGLQIARNHLEAIKKKFPGISYADLYTLAGVVAVEEMGGPTIKWRPGRTDAKVRGDETTCYGVAKLLGFGCFHNSAGEKDWCCRKRGSQVACAR